MGALSGLSGTGGLSAIMKNGYDPNSFGGLQLWLRADKISGKVDNDPITTWFDLSGNGNDAAETTNPPTYKTNILNGKPAVRFDGTSDILTLSTSLFSGDVNITFAAVYKDIDALTKPHTGSIMGQSVGTVTGTWFMAQSRFQTGATGAPYFAGYGADITSAAPDVNPHYALLTHDQTTVITRLDGTQVGTGDRNLNTTANNFRLAHSKAGEYLQGDIYEVLVWTIVLNSDQLTKTETYLASGWGL